MFGHRIDKSIYVQKGVGLLEVLVAVVVLAIGIMALARFQGGLSRSGSDAKARTVATNIAQGTMEQLRNFNTPAQFLRIANNIGPTDTGPISGAITRSGTSFNVSWTVTNHAFTGMGSALTAPPTGTNPTVKNVQVTVAWADVSGSSESVSLESFINASTPMTTGQTFTSLGAGQTDPTVGYRPGAAPEIVAIPVGDNNTMEATSPVPEVISRAGTQIVTFDEITYNASNVVQQRESFRTINCICNLSNTTGTGLTPVYLETNPDNNPSGDDDSGNDIWKEGAEILKTIGTKATGNNIRVGDEELDLGYQPQECDICCRDHHDPASPDNLTRPDGSSLPDDPTLPDPNLYIYYDPFRHTSSGDHSHYFPDNSGNLAAARTLYLEACRFIRINGIWRVAQDWRQESLQILPAEFLTTVGGTGISDLRDYVTEFLKAYIIKTYTDENTYPHNNTDINPESLISVNPRSTDLVDLVATWKKFPNSETVDDANDNTAEDNIDTPANIQTLPAPTAGSPGTTNNLIGRAIYVDFMDSDLISDIYSDIQNNNLKLFKIPFHEVNITLVSNWWSSGPTVANVTNEPISNSIYSRGRVTAATEGTALIATNMTRSVSGLSNTRSIDPDDATTKDDSLQFTVGGSDIPPTGLIITGSISVTNQSGIQSLGQITVNTDITGAACTKPTTSTYQCTFPMAVVTAGTPLTVLVSGYNYNSIIECRCSGSNTRYYTQGLFDNTATVARQSPVNPGSPVITDNETLLDTATFTFSGLSEASPSQVLNIEIIREGGETGSCPITPPC